MALIECKELTIGYENRTIQKNINFEINNGEYVCVFGDNGSGKSTLLKTLLGIKSPIKGHIKFDSSVNRKSIGYLPQTSKLKADFPASVYEVVISGCLNSMGIRPFYRKKEKEMAERNMRLLGVKGLANRPFQELSGGQQQRVLLARALCATDKILVLDEPFTGLDSVTTELLYNVLKKINQELQVTIIVVSHFMQDILLYADKVIYLTEGNLFCGTASEYMQNYRTNLTNISTQIAKDDQELTNTEEETNV